MPQEPIAQELFLDNLSVDEAVAKLHTDNIITANEQLREAVQPIVDDAANRGVDNLNVIYVDSEPINVDAFSFARQVVDQLGGTTIVRSPGNVSIASADFSRAAIANAENSMMEIPQDYPKGLDLVLTDLTDYVVPWVTYSIIVGLIIVATFVGLTFYWLRTRPSA